MKNPYVTFPDETEITHSDLLPDGTVKVYVETPVDGGFHNATCILPSYDWIDIEGYSQEEMKKWDEFIHHNAHILLVQ